MEKMNVNLEKLAKWPETNGGLFFILCLSTVLKVSIALLTEVIKPDGLFYISVAQQFGSGDISNGLGLYPMPSYPLLIALVHYFIPDWVAAAKLISVIASILILVPLYLITCDLFDRRAAFWGCLLFAIVPFHNEYAAEAVRGPVFLLFLAWAVYFANRAIRSTKLIYFFLASLFCWLSVLFRIEGIVFLPIYLLMLVFLAVWKRQERTPLLKGIFVWIGFPLVLFAVFFFSSGLDPASFNRISDVRQTIHEFFHLKFLDNYYGIQEQLKVLQESLPHPRKRLNFGEIARHFMLVIYLFGLLISLVKVLFPPFIVPLFLGLRQSLRRTHVLMLVLAVSFFLITYYTLIEKNFIQSRYLFAPAFLLFPWIGAGMERVFIFTKRSLKPKSLLAVLVAVFFVLPFYTCIQDLHEQDNIVDITGRWLAKKAEFNDAKMITNDASFAFYAGRDFLSSRSGSRAMAGFVRSNDYIRMENLARRRKADLIVLKFPLKKCNSVPEFTYYKKVKEFAGGKNIAVIYCSTELCKTMSVETRI